MAVHRREMRKFKPGDAALMEALTARTGGKVIKGAFHGTLEGLDFRVRPIDQSKRFILSVVCPFAGRFRVTPAGRLDRWLAGILPSARLPSRDTRFDREVCVQTRDREVTGRVITDPNCRKAVRALLDGPGTAIALEGDRVKLYGPRQALGLEPDVDTVLGLIAQLGSIGRVITDFTRGHEVRATPAHDSAKIIAWSSVIGLFLLGGAAFITAHVKLPLLHPAGFLWTLLGIGLALVPFVAFGLAHLVSGRTAPGRLWLPLVLLALFAVPLATAGAAYLFNGLADHGDAILYTVPITHTHTYKQKNKRRYQVGIDAWWAEEEVRWFHVRGSVYGTVRAGGDFIMKLRVRPGRLGQPWIEDSVVERDDG
jgi:hypothetical protein